MQPKQFSLEDYTVFGGMLLISAGIGIYHGLKRSNNGTAAQFLTGAGQLKTIPVALSMLASFLSSITLMGQPAEVYLYGPQLWAFGIAFFVIVPFTGHYMIPFFRKLNKFSAYEYFGDRFSKSVQILASALFTFQMVMFLALVLYAPALALHQATGLNSMLVVSIMYVVCIFYTTIGGMRAVVWTDAFQVAVLFVSMIAIVVKGTIDIGGINEIWARNEMFERTNFFTWSVDPTERYTFWSAFIGASFLHFSTYGGSQLQVQRYMTVSSSSEARKMLWVNTFGWTAIVFLTVYTGMLIFAAYSTCDPLKAKIIAKSDQLFPLYVMDTLHSFPGFPGLFISGIFSAGLSTVSTGMNSLAAIWFKEFEHKFCTGKLSDGRASLVVKLLAMSFGIVSYLIVFLVPYMGGLVPFTISLNSICSGSLFALFLLGLFFKKANAVGATCGLLASVLLMSWITIGNITSAKMYNVGSPPLPSVTSGCASNVTLDLADMYSSESQTPVKPDAFVLFRISYLWYCFISIATTIVVGVGVSYFVEYVRVPSFDTDSNSDEQLKIKARKGTIIQNDVLPVVTPLLDDNRLNRNPIVV